MKVSPAPPIPRRATLVEQTVRSLRDGIAAGTWSRSLPGERKLCQTLQVSRRTLRAALAEMQARGWLDVVTGKRRRITRRVSGPRGSKARKVVAVLSPVAIPDSETTTVILAEELREKLQAAGCIVQFHANAACFSGQPGRSLATLVRENPADAWVLLGSKAPMQRWFIRHRLPCVVAGSCGAGIPLPSVDIDHRAICRHAGTVLWRKGRRRIALVLPKNAYGGHAESEEGLREVLAGMPGAELQVLRHNQTAAHLERLVRASMAAENPPTAFLVCHAAHALTVMTVLANLGRRVPADVAIICRDDASFLQWTSPPLTRYAVDRTQIAKRLALAARRLAETGTQPIGAVRLMSEFVPGGST